MFSDRKKTIIQHLKRTYDFLIEVLFPSPREIIEMENMDIQYFYDNCTRCETLVDGVFSIFSYKDQFVEKALWEIKYRRNEKISALLGLLLYDEILSTLGDVWLEEQEKILLIGIPPTQERQMTEGFDQVASLVEAILRVDEFTNIDFVPATLRRTRETKKQTNLNRTERINNMKNVFSASAHVRGRKCVVIDDVATTGSTLYDAKRALKKAGAKDVYLFSVAH